MTDKEDMYTEAIIELMWLKNDLLEIIGFSKYFRDADEIDLREILSKPNVCTSEIWNELPAKSYCPYCILYCHNGCVGCSYELRHGNYNDYISSFNMLWNHITDYFYNKNGRNGDFDDVCKYCYEIINECIKDYVRNDV